MINEDMVKEMEQAAVADQQTPREYMGNWPGAKMQMVCNLRGYSTRGRFQVRTTYIQSHVGHKEHFRFTYHVDGKPVKLAAFVAAIQTN